MDNEVKRIEWIDICRFLSIVLVVVLHFGVPRLLDGVVHIFHMPIFYLISGLCFRFEKHCEFKHFLLSRVRSLLVPYFVFSVLFYAFWTIWAVCTSSLQIVPFKRYCIDLLWTNAIADENLHGGVQWFLTSLFFTELLFWVCCKIESLTSQKTNCSYFRYILSAVIALVGFLFIDNIGFRLPLALDTALPMLGFYSLGNLLSSNTIYKLLRLEIKHRIVVAFVMGMICLVGYFTNGYVNVRMLSFNNPFIYYISATAGCYILLLISISISKLDLSKYSVYKRMLYIGRNTIIILYIHELYIGLIKTQLISRFLKPNLIVLQLVYMTFTILFFAFIAYPICKFINSKCPFIIGKKREKKVDKSNRLITYHP